MALSHIVCQQKAHKETFFIRNPFIRNLEAQNGFNETEDVQAEIKEVLNLWLKLTQFFANVLGKL